MEQKEKKEPKVGGGIWVYMDKIRRGVNLSGVRKADIPTLSYSVYRVTVTTVMRREASGVIT
jgi:hypothetical protein